jgi:hypothetical protein
MKVLGWALLELSARAVFVFLCAYARWPFLELVACAALAFCLPTALAFP